MLQVKNISKQFRTGELVQHALNGVSLNLRDNEFVSILGPSGSGKTTLLNIIGGLDRYDSGDLVINGVSTKEYKDRDWDSYRNHTIGFVFQSYNLIPHQSILQNVELALTISGVSRSQRRERAKKALEEVGLADQLHKRPNQLSGGQMQRVAIARALVNDPEILLADEPTGALDTETSIQVMELLKQVAKDRLVVMVTHNPELAQQYSTRIVKLRDGKIVGDTNPFTPEEVTVRQESKKTGKAKMSFLTSLSLSFNNLLTKKGRTILTAFAGSIGIIGIALILALSSGVNTYIADIQKETMTSYPITISSQAMDTSSMMGMQNSMMAGHIEEDTPTDRDAVYADYTMLEVNESMKNSIKENNLTEFKKYLDDPSSEIHQYLGENGIVYSYGVHFNVYSYNEDDELISSDADIEQNEEDSPFSSMTANAFQNMSLMRSIIGGGTSGAENFSELMPGSDGKVISPILTDSYDMLYGRWPESYNEVVLVLDRHNSISAGELYQLGLLTSEEYETIAEQIQENGAADEHVWDYEKICGHTFYMLPSCDHYEEQEDGTFVYIGDDDLKLKPLLDDCVQLKITGVIRPAEGANNAEISTPVAYTSLLTDHIIEHTNESAVVKAQEADETVNVLSGVKFEAIDDAAKADAAKQYISSMGVSEKASFYSMMMYYSSQKNAEAGENQQSAVSTAESPAASPTDMGETTQPLPEGTSSPAMGQGNPMMDGQMDEAAMAAATDRWLETSPDEELLLSVYDQYLDGSSLAENLESFGKVSYDAPSSISMYTDSFEDKDAVSDCITRYNEGKKETDQITYTDYVALLTGSVTTIINVISYVLIAFVAVSLIVSSIMIGIITHISVLERTKEIGILRSIGASKRNISQVFNAETVIIGLLAGILGVGVTVLLTFPINSLLQSLLDTATLSASLPLPAALLLILLSIAITVIAGLLPAKSAAKKDPVTALRTE